MRSFLCICIISPMRILKIGRRAERMRCLLSVLAVLAARVSWCADSTSGANDVLLNLFVEKGYVSKQEADSVKAEAAKRQAELDQYKAAAAALQTETDDLKAQVAELKAAQTDLSQTNNMPELMRSPVGKALQKVVLFGDIRLRYESREAQDSQNGNIKLDRERYSIRLGVRGDLADDFSYGLRLETSSNPRSSWVSMGTSASGTPYQGPFGKSTAGINVGQAFIGWHHDDWVDIKVGKMPNPLYTTPMVWSGSLNPEGAAETFKHTVGDAEFFATFGQFVYQDANPNQASPGYYFNTYPGNGQPIFLLAWQGGFNYHLTKQVSLKVAPVLYYYSGDGANTSQSVSSVNPSFADTYVGQGIKPGQGGAAGYSGYPGGYYDGFTANQTGINDLRVLEIPAELNFKSSHVNVRLFGDYAVNLLGNDRAQAAYTASQAGANVPNNGLNNYAIQPISSAQTQDVVAYQFGIGFGSTNFVAGPMQGVVYGTSSSRNAWEVRTYWQHIEQYSLDPNLIDTDFFNGCENMQGIFAAVAYGLSDNVIVTFRYGNAQRINANLGTGGSGQDIPQMNPISRYTLFQVDLGVRF